MDVIKKLEERQAKLEQGNWYPACGGTEVPVKKGHYTYLYCWQPSTGKHAYLCLETDMILSDEQALNIFGG